jgi:hypothetical protein
MAITVAQHQFRRHRRSTLIIDRIPVSEQAVHLLYVAARHVQRDIVPAGGSGRASGALLWTSPCTSTSILPGHDPGLCARAETDASASVGTEFQLFGLRAALSSQVFDHPLPPAASFPRSPECITS